MFFAYTTLCAYSESHLYAEGRDKISQPLKLDASSSSPPLLSFPSFPAVASLSFKVLLPLGGRGSRRGRRRRQYGREGAQRQPSPPRVSCTRSISPLFFMAPRNKRCHLSPPPLRLSSSCCFPFSFRVVGEGSFLFPFVARATLVSSSLQATPPSLRQPLLCEEREREAKWEGTTTTTRIPPHLLCRGLRPRPLFFGGREWGGFLSV